MKHAQRSGNRRQGYRFETNSPVANKIQNQSGSGLIYVKFVDYGKSRRETSWQSSERGTLGLRITEHIRAKRKQDCVQKLPP